MASGTKVLSTAGIAFTQPNENPRLVRRNLVGAYTGMKPKAGNTRKSAERRKPMWNSELPMEWLDPMSWRLPSGKALAEFALQAGFLAPVMLGTPRVKRRKPEPARPEGSDKTPGTLPGAVVEKQLREGPDAPGAFRGTR